MSFIHEDFLLSTKTARKLYRQYAEAEPIFDYHCHLSPRDIAANRQFNNLFEIWLEGDHYKWRAMRANGVDERFCTGHASPFEKFRAWAATVPHTLRNPLYHWTHLELKRYFGITELLDEKTADQIWRQANEKLATPELTAQGILKKFDAGLHLKTAGTTWLEEVIGLAEAGGDGLVLAKDIYADALEHLDELCAPYATVIDIDRKKLPAKETVNGWTSEQFVSALRHDQKNRAFNPSFRQLLHVGFKIAAKKGDRYLNALKQHEAVIAKNVTENLFERHMKPLLLGK